MAQLAIKGHPTRGREVIEILEMLGGKNEQGHNGNNPKVAYYICDDNIIRCDCVPNIYPNIYKCIDYTLEEFLEKYPYKVGDKVQHKGATSCGTVYVIEHMNWVNTNIEYEIRSLYDYNHTGLVTVRAEDLQPYKEETMDKAVFDANAQCCDIMNHLIKKETMEENLEQITLDIPDGYEFFGIDDNNKVVFTKKQPQYPKTYEECVNIFNCTVETVNLETLKALRELIYCRNAYWKIAGEQMGLGKPWKPDWDDKGNATIKYCICISGNVISKDKFYLTNFILSFPTEEMRDAFYENFKELIEQCKELL